VHGSQLIEVPDDPEAFYEFAVQSGWTDGLPLIPPTASRVKRMLEETTLAADAVVAIVPPSNLLATVGVIAANAVMAGCRPEYLPVVIAAVDAVCDPAFDLYGIQATTAALTPAVIVSGPAAQRLEINGGGLAFGHGSRSNATIGRALRLVLLNVGGARPREVDKATQGQPGTFTLCFTENTPESPWKPFHVRRGFSEDSSVVTVIAVQSVLDVLDAASTTGLGLLRAFVSCIARSGTADVLIAGGPLIAFCPEHAQLLARDGFDPATIQRFLYEHARVPISHFSADNIEKYLKRRRPVWVYAEGSDTRIPLGDSADDYYICVVGGPGPHSTVMSGAVESRPVSRLIFEKENS